METLIGYSRAKEEIQKGDLVAILKNEKGEYIILNVDDRLFTGEAMSKAIDANK